MAFLPVAVLLHVVDALEKACVFGAENGVGEPLFVPRGEGAAEDDGWVLVLAYDHARNTSDFHILDARNLRRLAARAIMGET